MSEQVQTETFDYESEVRNAEPRPTKELSYEFSNGRKFYEDFIPTTGAYEE